MAQELNFTDHTARWTDADGDEHDHTVTAAVVVQSNLYIKEQNERGEIVTLPRQVTQRDGTAHSVRIGDVIVTTDRPNVYDVVPAALWSTTGYGGASVTPPAGIPARTVGDLSATAEPLPSTELSEVLTLLKQLAASNNAGATPTQDSAPPVPVVVTDANVPGDDNSGKHLSMEKPPEN